MPTISDLQNEIAELRMVLRKHINDGDSLNYDQLLHVSSPTITHVFMKHLNNICSKIEEPPHSFGRKPIMMKDIIFALALETYLNMPIRNMMFYLNRALEIGYIERPIHYNTLSYHLNKQVITQPLQSLLNTGYTSDNKDLLMLLCKHVECEMDKEIKREV